MPPFLSQYGGCSVFGHVCFVGAARGGVAPPFFKKIRFSSKIIWIIKKVALSLCQQSKPIKTIHHENLLSVKQNGKRIYGMERNRKPPGTAGRFN